MINLISIIAKGDSTSLKNKYILKNSQTLGLYYYGWGSFAFGGGEKAEIVGWGFGKLVTYERFIFNRFSLAIGFSQLNSKAKNNKFKMQLITAPLYFSYYPKFFKNMLNFNFCIVNGYQKYTFNNDSLNFQNFQTNLNIGLSLLILPKKLFKKPNNHWIFELNTGIPIYNFTYYPELPSGGIGIKYYFGK